MSVCLLGYIILISQYKPAVSYFACFLAVGGVSPGIVSGLLLSGRHCSVAELAVVTHAGTGYYVGRRKLGSCDSTSSRYGSVLQLRECTYYCADTRLPLLNVMSQGLKLVF